MYAKFFKRFFDLLMSFFAIVILLPLFFLLIIVGFISMKGSPFFIQERPGKNEKIFKLIKFRTMDNRKRQDGSFLPDDIRLNKYGRFLRKTSLDELPELLNIFIGHMSFIGPRPLMVRYLPYYTDTERLRHSVRPGLTGYAQINGRNAISWDERFKYDIEYVKNITFFMDLKIFITTIKVVFKREGIDFVDIGNLDDCRKPFVEKV